MNYVDTLARLARLLHDTDAVDDPDLWLSRVRAVFDGEPPLHELASLVPDMRSGRRINQIKATRALISVAIERLTARLALDEAIRESLRPVLDDALYASRPFLFAKYLAAVGVVAILLTIFGGVFSGIQVSSVYTVAQQSRGEILLARDDAIAQAQNDERAKLDQLSNKIASLSQQAEKNIADAQNGALADIQSAHDKAVAGTNKLANDEQGDLSRRVQSVVTQVVQSQNDLTTARDHGVTAIDQSANDARTGLRDHAESTWTAAEATGTLAINAQRDAVVEALRLKGEQANHQMDQTLGDLPRKITALDQQVKEIRSTKGDISLLLGLAPTFKQLINELNANMPGGNVRTILAFHEWGLILTPITLALSVVAILWLVIGWIASLKKRRRDAE